MRLGLGISIPGTSGLVQPAFSPLDLSPVLWLDAADTSTITESGGAVSQWDDKSGNGNNVTQGTAALQPTSGTRTINSLNVLDFDGSEYLTGGDILDLGTLGRIVFVVAEMDLTTGGVVLVSKSPDANQVGRWQIGRSASDDKMISLVQEASLRIARAPATFTATTPTIHTFRYQRDTTDGLELRTDGTLEASTTTVGTTNYNIADSFWIGTRDGAATLDGTIAEVIIVDGTLTADQIDDTESYLANKWGITL